MAEAEAVRVDGVAYGKEFGVEKILSLFSISLVAQMVLLAVSIVMMLYTPHHVGVRYTVRRCRDRFEYCVFRDGVVYWWGEIRIDLCYRFVGVSVLE